MFESWVLEGKEREGKFFISNKYFLNKMIGYHKLNAIIFCLFLHTLHNFLNLKLNFLSTLTLYLQNQTLSYINLFTMDHQLKCRAGATFTIYILQMDIDNNYLLLWMRKFQVQHSLLLLYTMNVREIDAEFEKLLMINIRKVRMSIIINSIYIWCPLKTHANTIDY